MKKVIVCLKQDSCWKGSDNWYVERETTTTTVYKGCGAEDYTELEYLHRHGAWDTTTMLSDGADYHYTKDAAERLLNTIHINYQETLYK